MINKNFPWYDIALGEIGQTEIEGAEDNPRIVEYLKTVFTFNQHDEIAWCSSFVNWCMLNANYHGTHSALARSWLYYGHEITKPEKGAIIILRRGSEPWQGHVGFFDSEENGRYKILGGNQHNSVCFQVFDKSKVIGMRWPE
jgi:uncharacterized protein (TIGR02594 family)